MKKELVKSLVDPIEIFEAHGLFVFPSPFPDALHQCVGLCLEKNNQVRGSDSFFQNPEQLFVKPVVIVFQVHSREDPVLVEEKVRHRGPAEKIDLSQVGSQMVSPEKKENLGLKGELLGVLIKIDEEGILIYILKQGLAVHFLCEHPGKARLADPKGPLNGNVVVHLDVARYPPITEALSYESAIWIMFAKLLILFM
jgi:hypothetical protein